MEHLLFILLTFDIYLIEIHKVNSKGTWRKTIWFKLYWDDWKGDSVTALGFFSSRVCLFFPPSKISTIIHINTSFSLSTSLQRYHNFSDWLYYIALACKERLGQTAMEILIERCCFVSGSCPWTMVQDAISCKPDARHRRFCFILLKNQHTSF